MGNILIMSGHNIEYPRFNLLCENLYIEMIEDKLKDGEKYEDGEYAQFRLKWCGDDNNCFETKTHDVDSRDFEDDFEDELRSWRETECQKGDDHFSINNKSLQSCENCW